MPKVKRKRPVEDLVLKAARDSDICPECLKKNKVRHRSDQKMPIHYQKKHPGVPIPDKWYKGPKDIWGFERIAPYSGPFPVGTRVLVKGFEDAPKVCPECGKTRDTVEKMRRHYDKKHKSKPYPDKPKFDFHRDILREIDDGFDIEPIKGTVSGVTPAGYGGPRVPALIHVRLDRPIDIHNSRNRKEVYHSLPAMTCYESELRRLVKKK